MTTSNQYEMDEATGLELLLDELRGLGVRPDPTAAQLRAWYRLDPATVYAAIDGYRASKGPDAPILPKYLAILLGKRVVAAGTATPALQEAADPAWWLTDKATIAKGKSLGLTAKAGESMPQFQTRIREAMRGAPVPAPSVPTTPAAPPPTEEPPDPEAAAKIAAMIANLGFRKAPATAKPKRQAPLPTATADAPASPAELSLTPAEVARLERRKAELTAQLAEAERRLRARKVDDDEGTEP